MENYGTKELHYFIRTRLGQVNFTRLKIDFNI